MAKNTKPLGGKAYGSIPHLPCSQLGPGDHHCDEGIQKIVTEQCRPGDLIVVQEKLDGSCVAVHKDGNGNLTPLIRAGYRADQSDYPMHHFFHEWVMQEHNYKRIKMILQPGERLCGEWLAVAHGTRYRLWHDPFVPFDIMHGKTRHSYFNFMRRIDNHFVTPFLVHLGGAISVRQAYHRCVLERFHAPFEGEHPEGLIYRLETSGYVDQIVKWVQPNAVAGKFLNQGCDIISPMNLSKECDAPRNGRKSPWKGC